MERMKIYRPLKAPPRPESIKILSPFGEKLLMMLQENRIQDNTRHYFGNHSQTNTCRRFGDEDIMQQLERWDGDGKAMTFPSSLDSPSSIASFLKPMVAKTRVNLQMKSTPTSNSTVRPNSTDKNAGYNLLQRQPPISTASNDSTVGNSSDTISIYNVAHQSSSAQNQIAVKRPSIFAEELGNARKTPKFQVPLRQTQPKCYLYHIAVDLEV
ncbi:uncharacterized protein LOC120352859 [Nilaparvata lugens]|uniref:uncharacterized protein LOC120352859 n=1 Tax=Nilaparvata lugens TaxID=108931 RepID=UPI00193E4C29|nr:uncharacterized protein LOC120352859 [Nilaparvata lugens]